MKNSGGAEGLHTNVCFKSNLQAFFLMPDNPKTI